MEQAHTNFNFAHGGDQCDDEIKIWIIMKIWYTLFQSRPFIENLNISVFRIRAKRSTFKRISTAEEINGTNPYRNKVCPESYINKNKDMVHFVSKTTFLRKS